MQLAFALLASVLVSALLLAAVGFLSRRVRLVRTLALALGAAAIVAGLATFARFQPAANERLDLVIRWSLVFVGSIALLRIAGLYLFEVLLRDRRGLRLPPLLPRVVMGVLYVVVALVTLRAALPDYDFTAVVATSAVTSLVLGLALQPILGNFFAGVVIGIERPFRINDWIRYGEIDARVVDLRWRTTHLRTRENDNLVVPNAKLANEEILNYFYPHPLHLERIRIGVHYRTPPYRVKQALLDVAGRVEGVLEKPSPEVFLHEFGDSAIVYELRLWTEDIAHVPRIRSHAQSEIWQTFKRRDIVIPFPIRTLEIEPRAGTLELARAGRTRAVDDLEAHPARLFVARGLDQGRSLALSGERVTIGRAPECNLSLRDPQASKEHASIEWEEGHFVLRDLDSHHGVLINGRKVDERRLRHLDRIRIGDTVVVYERDVL